MDVSLIKFTVLRHDEHAAKFHKLASQVEFKLGLGPCGRYVDHLESQIDYHGITITQTSYPEDWAHVNKTALTMLQNWRTTDRLIHGRGYPEQKGYGYGNVAAMTPTKEEHQRNKEAMHAMGRRATELQEQREIKTFFYKLEDVRGRIVAIKK